MSAYVDHLRDCVTSKRWPFGQSSHLIADDLRELDDWRRKLGLKAAWLQKSRTGVKHYDLSPGKFKEALAAGAVLLSDKDFVTKIREIRGDIPRA